MANGTPEAALVAAAPNINYHTHMEEKQLAANLKRIINRQTPTPADPETLLQTALTAYQTARIDGLCHQGAYEIALQTVQTPSETNASPS